jgi:hypothetical protein
MSGLGDGGETSAVPYDERNENHGSNRQAAGNYSNPKNRNPAFEKRNETSSGFFAPVLDPDSTSIQTGILLEKANFNHGDYKRDS